MPADAGEVGLIKIKTFSPSRSAALQHALRQVAALGVVDRSVGFRWNCGPMFQETMGALYRLGRQGAPRSASSAAWPAPTSPSPPSSRVIDRPRRAFRAPTEPGWLNDAD